MNVRSALKDFTVRKELGLVYCLSENHVILVTIARKVHPLETAIRVPLVPIQILPAWPQQQNAQIVQKVITALAGEKKLPVAVLQDTFVLSTQNIRLNRMDLSNQKAAILMHELKDYEITISYLRSQRIAVTINRTQMFQTIIFCTRLYPKP